MKPIVVSVITGKSKGVTFDQLILHLGTIPPSVAVCSSSFIDFNFNCPLRFLNLHLTKI